ncbi:MAG: STAS domain-containing protein [Actinobacteria bacterium]|nr:STAS domain-containing protein [Actinomycetota bacterium]
MTASSTDPRGRRSRSHGPAALHVIRLSGEVDVARRDELGLLAQAFVASGSPSVELDLADVDFMDSSGLQLIARLHRTAKLRGGTVHVVGAVAAVRRVIEVSGLDSLVEIHRTPR